MGITYTCFTSQQEAVSGHLQSSSDNMEPVPTEFTDEMAQEIHIAVARLEGEIRESSAEEVQHSGDCGPGCKCKKSALYKDRVRALTLYRAILAYHSVVNEDNIVSVGAALLAQLVMLRREIARANQ